MALSQNQIRKNFLNSIDTAFRIYGPAREWCIWNYESINENPYQPLIAAKVVSLSFLSVVAAWDEFVEESFLRYLCGTNAPSGLSPKLRIGRCKNLTHAQQALSGSVNIQEGTRQLRWSDYTWVIKVASIFFEKGKPYSSVTDRFKERLKDAQIIRNRVAHNSLKSKKQFKKIANKFLKNDLDSSLQKGFSPGLLLASQRPENIFNSEWLEGNDQSYWGDIFEAYMSMYVDLVELIVPDSKN